MPVINENSLKKVIMEILKKAGSDEGEASIVADHLVMSNLCGHDSHGLICVPIYLEYISQGVLKPNMPAKLLKDDGAILVLTVSGDSAREQPEKPWIKPSPSAVKKV